MSLTKKQKTILKDTLGYYIETTGKSHGDFISELSDKKTSTEYSSWLSHKILKELALYDITYADCLSNKDVLNETKNEASSRDEGEFYTPEVWCVEGRNYLKEMLGDKWGKVYIWDASCGTGNLMRTEGYPQDKLFLSTLLEEDLPLLQEVYPEATIFSCDFLADLDLDEYNHFFTSKLPQKLQDVLKNDEEILFYMNPPYRQGAVARTDVGKKMTTNGLTRSGLDLFNQFMYRILLLQETHNLTNLYAGIFGPITMFNSPMIKDLYNIWVDKFKHQDGMCFDASEFASTSTSVGWLVGYTTWRLRRPEEPVDDTIELKAKRMGRDGKIEIFGERLITEPGLRISEWSAPKDVVSKDSQLPYGTTHVSFGPTMEYHKVPTNALAFLMTSDFAIRGTRRVSVSNIVLPDTISITEENILRCIASFSVRRTYVTGQTAYDNSQYYHAPDVTKEGYEEFLANCVAVYLYDTSSNFYSYRGKHSGFVHNNTMFGLSLDKVKEVVTDENILSDIENNSPTNQVILNVLEKYKPLMCKEALELMNYCESITLDTLKGTKRKDLQYDNETIAWDTSFLQIRETEGLVDKEVIKEYFTKMSNLKKVMLPEIYKYGFLKRVAYS